MKNLIAMLSLLLFPLTALTQSNYTAKVVTDDVYWENQNEWIATFHAELRLNGVLQQPASSYYYEWWLREEADSSFIRWISGYGIWTAGVDDEHDQGYFAFVKITVPGGQVVTSDTVEITKSGNPNNVNLSARKEDGTIVSGFDADSIGLWSGYKWHWQTPGNIIPMSMGEYLKARPNFSSLGQKFHRGETIQADVRYMNYDSYPVYDGQGNDVTFHHRRYYDASVRAQLLDNPSAGYPGEFKDPWLEDQLGSGGEYRSLGMSADFKNQLHMIHRIHTTLE